VTTIEELQPRLPGVKLESQHIGASQCIGVAMFDGIMYWMPASVPADTIVQQLELMQSKGMLKK
jgi:hypothetical protein